LASGGVVVGYIRLIRILYDPQQVPRIAPESLVHGLIAIVAILVVSAAAVAPQLLNSPINWVLMAFHG